MHVHLHENDGASDPYQVIFSGAVGRDVSGVQALLERPAKCNFAGNVILEPWPRPADQLMQAGDRLLDTARDMSSEPEEK